MPAVALLAGLREIELADIQVGICEPHFEGCDPGVAEAVEAALVGQVPSDAVFGAAADALLKEAKGFGSNDFKIPLTRRTLIACLRDLTGAK